MAKISPIFKKAVSLVFNKPVTTRYPYQKPQLADNYRGQIQFNIRCCVGCGICSRDCPGGAIEMVEFYEKNGPNSEWTNAFSVTNALKAALKKP